MCDGTTWWRGTKRSRRRLPIRALIAASCAALAVGCAAGGRAPEQPLPLDVMTFNIRYGTAPDGANSWANRRELLIDVIRQSAPEVLGVQEALRFQLDELRRSLPIYGEIGVGRDDGQQRGEYAAILYDTRRLDLLDHGNFWFSATPEVPGSKSWGNNFPRLCSWGRFRDLEDGREFYVFNVHWDHESQHARDSSAFLLLRRIAAREDASDPVIVTGDFNAGETNSAFRTLLAGEARARRLIDTFRAVNPSAREVGTYHAFRGRAQGDKIDAVLVSAEWQIENGEILQQAKDGRYPSDHFPVVARIRLRR